MTERNGLVLALIHGHGSRERANSQTGDKSTDGELIPRVERRYLDYHSDDENPALDGHGVPPTEEVRGPD